MTFSFGFYVFFPAPAAAIEDFLQTSFLVLQDLPPLVLSVCLSQLLHPTINRICYNQVFKFLVINLMQRVQHRCVGSVCVSCLSLQQGCLLACCFCLALIYVDLKSLPAIVVTHPRCLPSSRPSSPLFPHQGSQRGYTVGWSAGLRMCLCASVCVHAL